MSCNIVGMIVAYNVVGIWFLAGYYFGRYGGLLVFIGFQVLFIKERSRGYAGKNWFF